MSKNDQNADSDPCANAEELLRLSMESLLDRWPSAKRALFAHFHIGGCQSCAYQPSQTLADVCADHGITPAEAVEVVLSSAEQEQVLLISARELQQRLTSSPEAVLLDIRTREEFEAVPFPRAELLTSEREQELFSTPPEAPIYLIDHRGRDVLDRLAWLHGHGLTGAKGLRGGVHAWSLEVDQAFPRYRLEVD